MNDLEECEQSRHPDRSRFESGDAYKRYVLTVVTLVYTLNFVDRGLVALLLQPIKEDLHLSDTQCGLLTGIAFGLFYAIVGIPLARWADRGNRVTITSLSIALWGLTVMTCLFVSNFVQLLFARVGAAVGEAGCMPPTYSLVGDYFAGPEERPRAMAFYMSAGPLSSLISFTCGGWLADLYGWRVAFFVAGIPALLIALLVKATIKEPRVWGGRMSSAPPLPRIADVVRLAWRQRSFRNISLALIVLYLMGYGLGPWYAAFMIRSHGMGVAELGIWLGLILGASGVAGTLVGGHIASRWFANNERAQMRMSALVVAALTPGLASFLLLPRGRDALIALTLLSLVWGFFFAPAFSLMQRLVANEMRATTLAVVMLFSNLVGMGVGPQLVGVLSDCLSESLGRESLRYAMLVVSLSALWAAYHFWQAGRTVEEDLAASARYTAPL